MIHQHSTQQLNEAIEKLRSKGIPPKGMERFENRLVKELEKRNSRNHIARAGQS